MINGTGGRSGRRFFDTFSSKIKVMEYKFRGKSIGSDKWVYGNLLQRHDSIGPLSLIEVQDKETFVTEVFHVYPWSVGQFVEQDRNKNDVYDGDVVKFYYWSTYEQRSFPEYVDFRETELKEGIGLVYWNDVELSWYVRPLQNCKKYTGNDTLSAMDEMPLAYTGASRESIDEWLTTNEGDDEYFKYIDCDGITVITNIHDNPELLNPPADSPALNTMNIYDPKEGQEEEVKAPATETEQEQVPGEETEG